MAQRVPFAEAISEPLLLRPAFDELSLPQQVALKSFYGLPLNDQELYYWSIFQGGVTYDSVGYPTKVVPVPYEPKEYEQAWCRFGRRSGKTDKFLAFVIAYEAVLGGHENYIKKGQKAICFLVSQNLNVARENYTFVLTTLEQSKLFAKEIASKNADYIFLKNNVTIGMSPPSGKALRGYAVPVVAMDEVGMWYSDADAASPDYEVQRAVKFAQLQFPNRKMLGTSTPWTKEGLLWKYSEAGTEGINISDPAKRKPFKGVLVMHAPTAVMVGKPSGGLKRSIVTRETLEKELDEDPAAFEREALANFVDSVSGYFNSTLLRAAVSQGVILREPLPREGVKDDPTPIYVAAIDPAFRRDAFGFTICHNAGTGGVVVDVAKRWKATPGKVLNPAEVLDEIKPYLDLYKVFVVYSDQYHLESLQQLAIDRGFSIEGIPFTAKSKASIFGNLKNLVDSKKLSLLDWSGTALESMAAKEMFDELVTIERRLTSGGNVQISAPSGRHDDMAAVLALCAFKAVWMLPAKAKKTNAALTLFEQCWAQVKRKKLAGNRDNDYD